MGNQNISSTISYCLKRAGGTLFARELRRQVMAEGYAVKDLEKTLDYMVAAGWLELKDEPTLKLLIDPDVVL